MIPFIVYGLPRSRTYWISRFLNYGDWTCGHDEMRHARTMDDVKAWFGQTLTGTVETAAAPWWRLVQRVCPEIRTVVVRRPVEDVADSLMQLGMTDRPAIVAMLERLDRKLDQIEQRVPNVLSVSFHDLASEATCAALFEHCLPYRHNSAWWSMTAPLNLQINFPAMLRYYAAYQPQLDRLGTIARHQEIAALSRKPMAQMDDVTIAQEPFETFFRDGQTLFAEHLIQVGEAPDAFWSKNLPLMQMLEQIGALQITTARSNGRIFGYLMAVISPSLESEGVMSALHTTFFASTAFRGLGMKLQRASMQALRERGVDELLLRAGERGDGPRMEAFYRRLGAADRGHLYSVDLKAA